MLPGRRSPADGSLGPGIAGSSVPVRLVVFVAVLMSGCAGGAGDGRLQSSETAAPAFEPDRPPEPSEPGRGNGIETRGDFKVFYADADQVELMWRDAGGRPYGQLQAARERVEADGGTVRLILNAGLYQPGLIPAGLHVEDGVELRPINLNEGGGNFHLMPNGVFYIDDRGAGVAESNAYAESSPAPRLAVQSGPMLTIDGAIHPRFGPSSESRFVRNGVGVTEDGRVVFMQSTKPVTLWGFANAFLDAGAPNSLYLDGSIARMEAPIEGRSIFFNVPFAGMLVVVADD